MQRCNLTNIPFSRLEYIRDKKQRLINSKNARENSKRIPHTYQVNDQVLLIRAKRTKHGEREYDGPFEVLEINNNGSVRIQKTNYSDVVHMRQLIPYKQ